MHPTKEEYSKEYHDDCRPIGEYIERMYKTTDVSVDELVTITMMCEAYENSTKLVDLYNWPWMPEYMVELDWCVYRRQSSITKAKKYITNIKQMNHFVTFARKYLKMSLADTLRFLKIVGEQA
ncbi:hypothetical protein NVP3058O_080 [Vibrio phage 3.058.O._10N.286.46.B8]|nr:hypothetical protein NVP2058O_081 [Vibrio phage 2.058.O._10N.286.46.B8]AUS03150.1 hypothetical protein NVP3058O_080 [Vibrio phage 3.058.O._10N.286.46.B8]